jgi:hypothetical protein
MNLKSIKHSRNHDGSEDNYPYFSKNFRDSVDLFVGKVSFLHELSINDQRSNKLQRILKPESSFSLGKGNL